MKDTVFDSLEKPVPGIRGDLDIIPLNHEGRKYLFFHDMLGYATQNFALDASIAPVLTLLDGRRNITDLHKELTSDGSMENDILKFIQLLDANRILYSQNFRDYKEETESAFEASEMRPVVCAGASYPDNEETLRKQFDEAFSHPKTHPVKTATALYAPHIDPRVGMSSYVDAFTTVRDLKPERVIVLATSHYAGLYGKLYEESPFIVTRKHFETPLGIIETDRDIVDSLIRNGKSLGVSDRDRAHRIEHSIELHLIFLKYLWSHNFTIVPILVNSFDELLYAEEGHRATQINHLAEFLRNLFEPDGRTLFLISGDLAHFGKKFGDQHPAENYFDEVTPFDNKFLDCASKGSDARMLTIMRETLDQYRICGFPPLLTFLKSFPGLKGEILSYDLWDERERESAVTFGSVLYR